MKGRLIDLSLGMNRLQRVTIELLGDFAEDYNRLKDGEVSVEIKKFRKARSLNANAYFHVLVEKIAVATKSSNDEIKEKLNLDYGTLARLADGGIAGAMLPIQANINEYYPYAELYQTKTLDDREYACYLFYKRTSELDSAEMARLIDGTIREAKDLGIETMTPEELARLEGYSKDVL